VGSAVVVAVGAAVQDNTRNIAVGMAVIGAIFRAIGGSVGVMQWLVLRWQIPRAGWWVLPSIVGWTVGAAVGMYLGDTASQALVNDVVGDTEGNDLAGQATWFGVAFGATIGTAVGLMQWLVLRRQVSWAGWWILANIIAWSLALGIGVGSVALSTLVIDDDLMALMVLLVGVPVVAAVPGAITGIVLVRLLRQSVGLPSDRG